MLNLVLKAALLIILVVVLHVERASAQTTWSVREVQPFTGSWTLTQQAEGRWTGKGTMSGQYTLTYDIEVIEKDGIVAARRTNSSDQNDCLFFGNRNAKQISGTYFCSNGGPRTWTANTP